MNAMNAVEVGSDGAVLVGDVVVTGAVAASEVGVDIFRATYDPNALFRTVDVTGGYRLQAVQ